MFQQSVSTDSVNNSYRLHSITDRAIFWSTPLGNVSCRPHGLPSYFISDLCDIFDSFGRTESLETMVKRVNKKMTARPEMDVEIGDIREKIRLASEFQHCLLKNLYFFPQSQRSDAVFNNTETQVNQGDDWISRYPKVSKI